MSGIDKLKKWIEINGRSSALPEAETCLASLADELNSCDQRTKRFKCLLSYTTCLDNLFWSPPVSNFNGTDFHHVKFADVQKCKDLLKKCI